MPLEYATGIDGGSGTDYLVTLVCTFAIYEWLGFAEGKTLFF